MQPVIMPVLTLPEVAFNLALALLLGAAIGFERQWRQRLAGLRTNTLVALGSAGFVVFSQLVSHEMSPTRVAAQVVSGIGFLGAGVIFKEGLNVRGLNTAATLWCSAAVGLLAGIGQAPAALLLTALIVGVNLGLRPLVARIDRQVARGAGAETPHGYRLSVTCPSGEVARLRGLLLQAVAADAKLHLRRLANRDVEGAEEVEVVASLWSEGSSDAAVEAMVGRLALDPAVTAAAWSQEATAE
ncbi:MAG: MgtC/SapB family protein [Roseococcus sp.]|nr:MgtC/SapB family protein [Roseococcus sp.]